ncbi:speckle-type POZ protein-like [Microplitis demolitor]|uniref:speckle-type POZ protein-like n=1 Tax=Microplitis demolitor TaxID=69319 RepID=UPI0004CDCE25|nr:speckle-type POZ protein-like [Microplitis demolitor]
MKVADSKIGEHKLNHKWEIDDFASVIKRPSFATSKNGFFQSPGFSIEGTIKNLWYLRLSINGETCNNEEWLSLTVASNSHVTDPIRASCLLFIFNDKKKRKFTQTFCNSFESSHIDWCCEKFVKKNLLLANKDEFLPNNMLSIGIELTIFESAAINTIEISPKPLKRVIIDDLKKLLDQKIASDITLQVGDEQFKAHRAILMMRSPVFCKWLTHQTKENMGDKFVLSNISSENCKLMLEFIYTDKVKDLGSNVENLLAVADDYQLKGLKETCEELLCDSITVENAARIMVLAHRHNAKQLFDYVIEFVAINITRVMKTTYYVNFIKFYPDISLTLIEKLASLINIPTTPQTPEVIIHLSRKKK